MLAIVFPERGSVGSLSKSTDDLSLHACFWGFAGRCGLDRVGVYINCIDELSMQMLNLESRGTRTQKQAKRRTQSTCARNSRHCACWCSATRNAKSCEVFQQKRSNDLSYLTKALKSSFRMFHNAESWVPGPGLKPCLGMCTVADTDDTGATLGTRFGNVPFIRSDHNFQQRSICIENSGECRQKLQADVTWCY